MPKKILKPLIISAFLFFSIFTAGYAAAATLDISPSGDNFKIGDTFDVHIHINSPDATVNAAQATFQFTPDVLEVAGIDREGSIFSFWLQEPEFSNDAGTVSFAGGSPNGSAGQSLQVITINFRAKGNGVAILGFIDGAVTAADGSGTNVLTNLDSAQITVSPQGAVPVQPGLPPAAQPPTEVPPPVQIEREPTPAQDLPEAPIVDVPLYPDSEKWYNVSSSFLAKWQLPGDITNVATAINKDPAFNPTKSEGLFDNKSFARLDDGVWYLHVRFRNEIGWGPAIHYRLGVDTVPPAPFEVSSSSGFVTDSPNPTLNFSTTDQLSGLDYYYARIDNQELITIEDIDGGSFTLPLLAPGKHTVIVGAQDKAGNRTEDLNQFEILPIESPKIVSFSRDVFIGEGGLNVDGTSLADVSIIISVKDQAGNIVYTVTTKADESGKWAAKLDQPLKKGKYYLEVKAQDNRGALSLSVKSDLISVRTRPIMVIGEFEITQLHLIIGLALILLFGFFAGWYLNHLAETQKARKALISQRDIANVFNILESDIDQALKSYIDKVVDEREASEIEFLLKRIHTNIKRMQKYIIEEIKGINR